MDLDSSIRKGAIDALSWDTLAEPPLDLSDLSTYLDISDRYTEKKLIGTGAVKEVYSCYDNSLRKQIAFAQVREDRERNFDHQLLHEAWLTTSLEHPNVMGVHDIGLNQQGRVFFTMDLKSGDDYQSLVRKEERLLTRLSAFLKVCEAVNYAHSKSVVHLDLKPSNIQCGQFGEILVCDWGLGKQLFTPEQELSSHLEQISQETLYGDIKGSPGYMAPEQIDQCQPKDSRTDLFSLGCLLYFTITGHPPFHGDLESIISQTREAHYTPVRERYPALKAPKVLDAIINKALQKEPKDRYQSVQELQSDLRAFLEGRVTSVEPPSLITRARKAIGRHKTLASVIGSALMLLTVLSLFYVKDLQFKDRSLSHLHEEKSVLEDQVHLTSEENINLKNQLPTDLIDKLSHNSSNFWKSDPIASIQQQIDILNTLKQFSPNEPAIYQRLIYLSCIRLDFKTAFEIQKQHPHIQDHFLSKYGVESYAYHQGFRPQADQLAAFFLRSIELSPQDCSRATHNMLCAIARYDYYSRKQNGSFNPEQMNLIVVSLLQKLNAHNANTDIEYSPTNQHLQITSNTDTVTAPPFGESPLLYMSLRSLTIHQGAPLSLQRLNHLNTPRIDVSQSTLTDNGNPLTFGQIESLIVNPLQYDDLITILPQTMHHQLSSDK